MPAATLWGHLALLERRRPATNPCTWKVDLEYIGLSICGLWVDVVVYNIIIVMHGTYTTCIGTFCHWICGWRDYYTEHKTHEQKKILGNLHNNMAHIIYPGYVRQHSIWLCTCKGEKKLNHKNYNIVGTTYICHSVKKGQRVRRQRI